MAGYSGTPLAKKVGVKPGHTLVMLHAPAGWEIPALPDGVAHGGDAREADVVIAFYRARADLAREAAGLAQSLPRGSGLWIAWPRKAGGHVSDISENDLRDVFLPTGLVDVKVAALDDDWSGLKFLWRKAA